MANKPLKSLQFPGLENTYTVVGEAVPEGGEIFNDYENNHAFGVHSHAMGSNTVAGAMSYMIASIIENKEDSILTIQLSCNYNTYPVFNTFATINDADKVDISTEYGDYLNEDGTYKYIISIASNKSRYWTNCTSIIGLDAANSAILVSSEGIKNKGDLILSKTDTSRKYYLFTPAEPQKGNYALGGYSIATGFSTQALGTCSRADGYLTQALSNYSHAEGLRTTAAAQRAHAEGTDTIASGTNAHAEGNLTQATHTGAHSEGSGEEIKDANNVVIETRYTEATGLASHAEGFATKASNKAAHAEGIETQASGEGAHAEGIYIEDTTTKEKFYTIASGKGSHAEGGATNALGTYSHTEGNRSSTPNTGGSITNQSAAAAHAEGNATKAYGNYSHAEGNATEAHGSASHAEGKGSKAQANFAHAEGNSTIAAGSCAHSEGNQTEARAESSHAEGYGTKATSSYQHVQGKWNYLDANEKSGSYAHIVGGGTSKDNRKNIHTLDWSGNAWFAGDVQAQGIHTDTFEADSVASFNNVVSFNNEVDFASIATFKDEALFSAQIEGTGASFTGNILAANIPWLVDTETECFYREIKLSDNTIEKEWLNPPMNSVFDATNTASISGNITSKEFRTTERRFGKPIYTSIITTGADNKMTTITLGDGDFTIMNQTSFARRSDGLAYTMPAHYGNESLHVYIKTDKKDDTNKTTKITITHQENENFLPDETNKTWTIYTQIWYIKSTL